MPHDVQSLFRLHAPFAVDSTHLAAEAPGLMHSAAG